MKYLLILVALICAGGRFLIVPRLNLPTFEGGYEAFAHLFVGFLMGCWSVTAGSPGSADERDEWRGLFKFLTLALTLLEIAMFAVQKRGG